jgi:hypothetical protein
MADGNTETREQADIEGDRSAQQLLSPARGAPGPSHPPQAEHGGQQTGQPESGSYAAQPRVRRDGRPEQDADV